MVKIPGKSSFDPYDSDPIKNGTNLVRNGYDEKGPWSVRVDDTKIISNRPGRHNKEVAELVRDTTENPFVRAILNQCLKYNVSPGSLAILATGAIFLIFVTLIKRNG